jgi:malate dehydrogenase (oxaloacetate-decarboxylating)(NADP+)
MKDDLKQAALDYHRFPRPGKLEIRPTKQLNDQRDLSLAYSPGVAAASQAIEANPLSALDYTCKGNLVGVITNGTAVLGLGAIGALASKPVMEGKAVLFKQFAGIDVFDIEINETDPQEFINTVARLEPTFGGINLEDIKSPECFVIEQQLKQRMNIPVFHDDQHGTAVVVCAAMLNGLHLVGKKLEQVKLVTAGAGAAALACLDLLVELGLNKDNIIVADNKGVLYEGREEGMDVYKARYAVVTDARVLSEALKGADIFLGLSTANVLKPEWLALMAQQPLLFTLANPIPEIMPELAKEARPDAIIATGRSDYPNQVNNVLCFPFLFRGALDVGATEINSAMKMACVQAIAELARTEPPTDMRQAGGVAIPKFGPDYLIPTPFDRRLVEVVPLAVAQAAMDSGAAQRPIQDMQAYHMRLQNIVR